MLRILSLGLCAVEAREAVGDGVEQFHGIAADGDVGPGEPVGKVAGGADGVIARFAAQHETDLARRKRGDEIELQRQKR